MSLFAIDIDSAYWYTTKQALFKKKQKNTSVVILFFFRHFVFTKEKETPKQARPTKQELLSHTFNQGFCI
jgi:hypothetical protein